MARIAFLLLALFAEMERTFTAERAARAVAEAKGHHIGRPTAWPADKIDYARLLREQGSSLGEITSKTGHPENVFTSLPHASGPTRVTPAGLPRRTGLHAPGDTIVNGAPLDRTNI
jgi:hypothetical protein